MEPLIKGHRINILSYEDSMNNTIEPPRKGQPLSGQMLWIYNYLKGNYSFHSLGIDLAGGPLWQIIMPHPSNEG